MTHVFEATGATTAGDKLRGVLIDPWRRDCRVVSVPTRPLSCGCPTADGRALADLLGTPLQRAYPVLGAEILIVGVGVTAPSWTWGTDIRCRGFGLILSWGHALGDSLALPADVEAFVGWPRRRASARAA